MAARLQESSAERVLITGASSGFGRRAALKCAGSGNTVCATMRDVTGRNAARAKGLARDAETLPGKLHVIAMDVLDDDSVSLAVQQAIHKVGGIDVLINNAGVGFLGISESYTPEQVSRIFETNVVGSHRVTRAVLPQMRERGRGLVLYTGSIMGRVVLPFSGLYSATKFATEAIAESLAYELSGTGVEVTILQAGGFATEILEKIEEPDDLDRVLTLSEAKERCDALWSQWFSMLQTAAPDPDLVASAMLSLIQRPQGTRPLRWVVDPVTGGVAVQRVNEVCADVQAELLRGVGFSHAVPIV